MSGNVYGSGKIEEIQKFKNSKIQKKKNLVLDPAVADSETHRVDIYRDDIESSMSTYNNREHGNNT